MSIYTDGTFGLLPYAIEIYLVDNPSVKIYGIYPMPKDMPEEIAKDAQDHPTYIVFNQIQNPSSSWPLQKIAEYQKGNRTDVHMRLYQVISPAGKL